MTDGEKYYFESELEIRLETTSAARDSLNGRASEADSRTELPRFDWASLARLDEEQPQAFDLGQLWTEARAGRWRFLDTYSTAERYFAVVQEVAAQAPSRVRLRNLGILESVLLGQPAKAVAIELEVAVSTVAASMQDTLRWMGLPGRLATAPVLTMAARAACVQQAPPILGRLTQLYVASGTRWLISVRRPDLDFPVRLSKAEAVVVRQLIAGRSHAEISTQRATSLRTVANQLATAFRKFGVSGRGALLHELITHSLKTGAAATAQGGHAAELRA